MYYSDESGEAKQHSRSLSIGDLQLTLPMGAQHRPLFLKPRNSPRTRQNQATALTSLHVLSLFQGCAVTNVSTGLQPPGPARPLSRALTEPQYLGAAAAPQSAHHVPPWLGRRPRQHGPAMGQEDELQPGLSLATEGPWGEAGAYPGPARPRLAPPPTGPAAAIFSLAKAEQTEHGGGRGGGSYPD